MNKYLRLEDECYGEENWDLVFFRVIDALKESLKTVLGDDDTAKILYKITETQIDQAIDEMQKG